MERIGKYRVRKALIDTDYSTLYWCRDEDLDIDVAVKLFGLAEKVERDRHYGIDFWRERFVAEARLMARIDNPHIVPVREFSVLPAQNGNPPRPYLVMPFVEANLVYEMGKDAANLSEVAAMEARHRPRRLAVGRAASVLGQLLTALTALHARGMVHRDVKPGNILLTRKKDGKVKLCDFGMVKRPTPDSGNRSRSGLWIGTLDYMSPEQRRDAKRVDARADVFSAAAVAYRMLTGKLPAGAFAPPRTLVPAMPEKLSELIMAALAADRDARPTDARAFLDALEDAMLPWPRCGPECEPETDPEPEPAPEPKPTSNPLPGKPKPRRLVAKGSPLRRVIRSDNGKIAVKIGRPKPPA